MKKPLRTAWMLSAALATTLSIATASAQTGPVREFRMPAQTLAAALRAIASASGTNILAPGALVEGRKAAALDGRYTVLEAVTIVLRGSDLHARMTESGLIIERATGDGAASAAPNAQDTIVVTGTRIRGAPVAAPVVRVSENQARNEGQATLADIVRSVPQSFGGGQQPGIGLNVPAAGGVDVGGATSINLRGLGSDATLTLLNGHRVAYSSSRQSVDVSTIPLSIVDRVEIVPDGASAIYGSDAVAGVANIILKRDFDGLETRARIGGSTDGGNFSQQYGALAGQVWSSGGVAVAYEYNGNSPIRASQRSYARGTRPGLDLYPELRSHSALLTGHQGLGPAVTLSVDALYSRRRERFVFPYDEGVPLDAERSENRSRTTSWAVAPSIEAAVGRDWRVSLSGTAANDRTRFFSEDYIDNVLDFASVGCYCNKAQSIEVGGTGTLLSLPGGALRAALGAGYRNNDFNFYAGAGNTQNIARSQSSRFAYLEASLPIFAPPMNVAGAYRLTATGALRYESYPGVGHVATPKFGLIYAPNGSIDFKGSWGKSFRAPTLRQQYQPKAIIVFQPSALGGSGYPTGSTAFYLVGGNPALKPEKATSWSGTVAFHPPRLGDGRVELSYFNTVYRDRIVTPIVSRSQALRNPANRDYITLSPSPSTVSQLVASAATFQNASGLPFTPASVVAIADATNVNAGRQRIHGVDALASYSWSLSSVDRLVLSGNASYLTSDQRITASQAATRLAGSIFNPPHFRTRLSGSWLSDPFTLTAVVSHIGSVSDNRSAPAVKIQGMTPVDLSLRYQPKPNGPLSGLDVSLSVQNVLNDKPTFVSGIFVDAPYDSTNYSPVGRFVSLSVAKRW